MKKIIAVILLLAAVPQICSAWYYYQYKPGWYLRCNNGSYSSIDNYVYVCRNGCYYRHSPVVYETALAHAPGWRNEAFHVIEQREDQAAYAGTMNGLGYDVTPVNPGGSRFSFATGNSQVGFKVVQQGGYAPGYAAVGNTYWGNTAQQNVQIDPIPVIQEAQRLAQYTMGLTQTAITGSNGLVSQATDVARINAEGNTAAAKMLAAGQVAVAAIAASAGPATTSVEGWRNEPAQQQQSYESQVQPQPGMSRAAGLYHEEDGSPLKPEELVRYGRLGFQECSECHGSQPKDNQLSLLETGFVNLDDTARGALAQKVWDFTAPGAKDHMPKGRNIQLPVSVRKGMAWMIRNARPAQARPAQPSAELPALPQPVGEQRSLQPTPPQQQSPSQPEQQQFDDGKLPPAPTGGASKLTRPMTERYSKIYDSVY